MLRGSALYDYIERRSFFVSLKKGNYPNPHSFGSVPLHSEGSLLEVISEVTNLLPQLANFISQFDATVLKSGVNVLTDTAGNMSIDVPNIMSDVEANKISTRLGIIDRLVNTRGQEINVLLQKGQELAKAKDVDSELVSLLQEKIREFKTLNEAYKH